MEVAHSIIKKYFVEVMICNTWNQKFCNKRNTIGVRCSQCNITVYCSDYCRRKDALSHKRICFKEEWKRREAFINIVKPTQKGTLVDLSGTYQVLDVKKKLVALCVNDNTHLSECIFCHDSPTGRTHTKFFEFRCCKQCILDERFICTKTLRNDVDCPISLIKNVLVFSFIKEIDSRDVIYYIISIFLSLQRIQKSKRKVVPGTRITRV